MISYLLKSGILLFIFFAIYKLFLENEKMFRFNRFYLLLSLIFSLVIPLGLFNLNTIFQTQTTMIQLQEIIIQTNYNPLNNNQYNQVLLLLLIAVYFLVAIFLVFRFAKNLYSFYRKSATNEIEIIDHQKVVLVEEPILPHSFWNSIFITKQDYVNGKIPSELIAHEKAHLQQKHTLDILFIEFLQIIFWFNPLLILFKKAIKLNHEFLADEAVNRQYNSVTDYQKLLLQIASQKGDIALASTINYLITKKRLLMMTKKESPFKIVLKVFTVGIVYSLLLFVFSTRSVAQENVKDSDNNESAIEVKKPEFPGGMNSFYMFVGQNFKLPEEASKSKINVKIFTQFMVEKDGSLSEFTIVRDAGYGVGDEAIRVLKLSPKWIPGSENGQPVRVLYSLPITIQSDK